MKSHLLFTGIYVLLFALFACDSQEEFLNISEPDCEQLIYGLTEFNNDVLQKEFDKITADLTPKPGLNDQTGHENNFRILIDRLNVCEILTAEMICYACIETYPPQTELLLSFDLSGNTVKRAVDMLTGPSALKFMGVHEYYTDEISLNKTSYFGCFTSNPLYSSERATTQYSDTIFYNIENDTLTLSTVINYNCAGLLKDSVTTEPGKVNIYISDICLNNCEARCMCNFGFEYKFTQFWQKNTQFNVYLKRLREKEYQLWKKVEFIDAPD